ncbi:cupin domain-containing protein [Microbulbifer sp. OS29]|uniref:Cupin domain-containing protein n=1 Tax=Microbulbifer okhotskensis TaxID=2926617 RepID=A0A9X2EQ35_9GAMM|nr:cupin domain-containing protein [Microbulbifer okhotskensis]MCO1335739.1 cupin domain-containing protein [Microbulbifer okhotskensis]
MNNLFQGLPEDNSIEHFDKLIETQSCRVERIVSYGQASPEVGWYDQSEQEWVLVLSGYGIVEMETGERVRLKAGDHLLIKAHQRHRVVQTSSDEPTIWLAVFYP